MTTTSRIVLRPRLLALPACAVLSLVVGCSDPGARAAGGPANTSSPDASADALPADQPLAAFQGELLDLAFRTASALPLDPHIKNRSRAQEAVVAACLQLDQPRRALGYLEAIENWRRGAAYADLAFYCAKHDAPSAVPHYLDLARQIADGTRNDEDAQDWHRDRIRARIAATFVRLGQPEQAAPFAADLVDSEVGQLEAAQARVMDAEACDEQIRAVDNIVATGNLEQVRNALETCAQIFDRFYQDAERRTRAEEKIKASWSKLPVMPRLELMLELTRFALDHGDQAKARALLTETRTTVDGARWTAEHRVPMLARLAALAERAGDRDAARSDAAAALALFDAERNSIIDMYRAGALRPLAEAYEALGDTATALKVYAKAVEEGVANFNSRPRAEDLSETCCSLALHGVQPDAVLWARMHEIHAGLGDPW